MSRSGGILRTSCGIPSIRVAEVALHRHASLRGDVVILHKINHTFRECQTPDLTSSPLGENVQCGGQDMETGWGLS